MIVDGEPERGGGGGAREPSTEPSTEVVAAAADEGLVQQLRLTVAGGAGSGRVFLSQGERVAIGSDAANDLVLDDRSVSRFHCEITVAGGEVTLRDLGSKNGTLVDGVSVVQARLRSGQTLTLGRAQLRFDLGFDSVRVPLSRSDRFGVMLGGSRAMRAAFARLEKAAHSDATVLLEGETGTGKEAAAESIHRESARRAGPLIVVDCGSIPPNLLESELFGHERGSFTGAASARAGAFEAADGGTIFLDEIGELSADLQPKLLRVLERREIKRIGANVYKPIDVRVIAATNRNLRVEVNEGRFRSDLFYRLAVVEVRLPPLRERPEDVPELVRRMVEQLGAQRTPAAERLCAPELLATIARHQWPGNVRELRNYVERCLALEDFVAPGESGAAASGQTDRAPAAAGDDGAAATPLTALPLKAARDRVVRDFERRYLEELLAAHDGVVEAARAAGIDRITLYRMLRRHGLK